MHGESAASNGNSFYFGSAESSVGTEAPGNSWLFAVSGIQRLCNAL